MLEITVGFMVRNDGLGVGLLVGFIVPLKVETKEYLLLVVGLIVGPVGLMVGVLDALIVPLKVET